MPFDSPTPIRPNPRWRPAAILPAAILENSNGRISATGHSIHFMFGSRVGFGGRRIEWRYFRLDHIQHISGMGYPSHLHEKETSFVGIWERIVRDE